MSSSSFTIDSTSSVEGDRIIGGPGASSWLHGFIGWLPSSSYSSSVAESGRLAGLWNGTAELFTAAVDAFTTGQGYERYEQRGCTLRIRPSVDCDDMDPCNWKFSFHQSSMFLCNSAFSLPKSEWLDFVICIVHSYSLWYAFPLIP